MDKHLGGAVAVVVVDRDQRPVDGELLKVGPVVAVQLRVEVRVEPALQQGVVGKVDAAHDVAGLEHDLLRLGEEVGRVTVQLQHPQLGQGRELLGDDLGRVQQVEAKGQRLVLVDHLHRELPGGAVARLDGVPEVLAVKVGVLARRDLRLLPHEAGFALERLEVPLDELGGAVVLDEPVRVDAEAVLSCQPAYPGVSCWLLYLPCGESYGECQTRPWPRTACAVSSAGS